MSTSVVIGSTYYEKGFFNQTKDMLWLPRNSDYSNISITIQCAGPHTNARVSAEIRYRGQNGKGAWINSSHYARIFARAPLIKWFSDNLSEGDLVYFGQVDDLSYTLKPASSPSTMSPSILRLVERIQSPVGWSKEDDWFWEGNIQDMIIKHLKSTGFDKVSGADTSTKEQGPDIAAYERGKKWVIEVKGYPSDKYVEDRGDKKKGASKPTRPATQARHWFSEALMSVLLAKSEEPCIEVGLGFPRMETYLTFLKRVAYFREKMGIHVFIVDENGLVKRYESSDIIL